MCQIFISIMRSISHFNNFKGNQQNKRFFHVSKLDTLQCSDLEEAAAILRLVCCSAEQLVAAAMKLPAAMLTTAAPRKKSCFCKTILKH